MRWNSVKKTAQWAVFRNSPEGFSLRGLVARSADRNPLQATIEYCRSGDCLACFVLHDKMPFYAGLVQIGCKSFRDAPHIAFQPSACVPRYAAPLLQGNMGHLAASRCPACESGIWIILLLSLFKKILQKLGNVLDGARGFL